MKGPGLWRHLLFVTGTVVIYLGCAHLRVRMAPTFALAASDTRYGWLQHAPWLHPTPGMGEAKPRLGLFEHPFRMHPCSVSGTPVPRDGCIRSRVWPDPCAGTGARIPRFGGTYAKIWTHPSMATDVSKHVDGYPHPGERKHLYRATDAPVPKDGLSSARWDAPKGTGRERSTLVSTGP